jgi:hypothetical protein
LVIGIGAKKHQRAIITHVGNEQIAVRIDRHALRTA